MKLKNNTFFIFIIVALILIVYRDRGEILSYLNGYPIGIKQVDRESYGISDINPEWKKFPKDNSTRATQIWIRDIQDTVSGLYAKKIVMERGLLNVAYEEDRYLIKSGNYTQKDLVYKWTFDKNKVISCIPRLEVIEKIELDSNYTNWFNTKYSSLYNELSKSEADSIKLSLIDTIN